MKKEVLMTDLNENQRAIIVSILGGQMVNKRLADLGLIPQTKIKVLRKAPFCGPIEIEARDSKLILGMLKDWCSTIKVGEETLEAGRETGLIALYFWNKIKESYNDEFQKPFKEGAGIITSSTHKTFQGPQGGIIIGNNNLDEKDWKKIEKALFPGIVYNFHIHRFPSLAITALEMNEFGKEYAKQVIINAKTLAEALTDQGFDVLCPNLGFTESHQIIVNVKEFGGGKIVADNFEECNIICNKMALPWDSAHDATKNPSGIRLGVQELTRFGMREEEMKLISSFFRDMLIDKIDIESVKKEVIDFRKTFQQVKYCFRV